MKPPSETLSRLRITPRQLECIEMVGEGMTSKEIGRKLNISHRTVEAHIFAVMDALEVSTRTAAVLKVRELREENEFIPTENMLILHGPLTDNYLITPAPPPPRPTPNSSRKLFFPPIGGQVNTAGKSQRLIWVTRITTLILVIVNVIILSIVAVSAMAEPAA